MDENLTSLLRQAAGDTDGGDRGLDGSTPASTLDGPTLRARAERRRRRRTIAALAVVAVLLALPVLSLATRPPAPNVLIDQPATPDPGNPTVYHHRLDVTVRATGTLADVVQVTLVEDPPVPIHALAAVIVASSEPLTLDLDLVPGVAASGASVRQLRGLEVVVATDEVALQPGVPVLVLVQGVAADPSAVDDEPPTTGPPLPPATTESLPPESPDGRSGELILDLVTVAVTGDELGLPGAADVPDQRLPRPPVGEAIPTKLDDGTPVWVVGLDDGEVSVVGARSTGGFAGLVGWCATMPGFIDSPGSARFSPRGGYAFGPAPAGLPTYDVDVATDHVVVTGRRAPDPRPDPQGHPQPVPPIEGAAVPQGPICTTDPEAASTPPSLEDYTGDPHWAQHDLGDWPAFDGQADGWYRTDTATPTGPRWRDAPGVPHLRGDLLVHRVGGETVDAAAPPGSATAELVRASEAPEPLPSAVLLTGIDDGPSADCPEDACPYGAIRIIDLIWVTPTGVARVTSADPPSEDAVLTPLSTGPRPHQVAADAVIDAIPGQIVFAEVHPGRGSIQRVDAAD